MNGTRARSQGRYGGFSLHAKLWKQAQTVAVNKAGKRGDGGATGGLSRPPTAPALPQTINRWKLRPAERLRDACYSPRAGLPDAPRAASRADKLCRQGIAAVSIRRPAGLRQRASQRGGPAFIDKGGPQRRQRRPNASEASSRQSRMCQHRRRIHSKLGLRMSAC